MPKTKEVEKDEVEVTEPEESVEESKEESTEAVVYESHNDYDPA